jgi:hypothetical protein
MRERTGRITEKLDEMEAAWEPAAAPKQGAVGAITDTHAEANEPVCAPERSGHDMHQRPILEKDHQTEAERFGYDSNRG